MKKLLSVIGLLTMVVPTTLNVVGCGGGYDVTAKELEVVSAINKAAYETSVLTNSSIIGLKKQLTSEFIKSKLSADMQTKFENNKFSLISLSNIETGNELSENDFLEHSVIGVRMFYRYGSISTQEGNLRLEVLDAVMATIKNIDSVEYQIEEAVGGNLDDLRLKITNEFIKTKLRADIQEVYRDSFYLNAIWNENGDSIGYFDYPVGTILKTRLDYSYEHSSGATKLEIRIVDHMTKKFAVSTDHYVGNAVKMLVPTSDGNFYVIVNSTFSSFFWYINSKKNEVKLERGIPYIDAAIQTSDGNFYCGFRYNYSNDNAYVAKFDIKNNRLVDEIEIPESGYQVSSIVQASNGNIYVATNTSDCRKQAIWKVDLKTNNIMEIANFSTSSSTLNKLPKLFASSNNNLYVLLQDSIYKIDLTTNWVDSYHFGDISEASIQFSDDKLLIATWNKVWEFDWNSKSSKLLFSTYKKITALVKRDDGQIVVIDNQVDVPNNVNVYGITPLQTQRTIEVKTTFTCHSWIFGPNNKLYFGTEENISSIYEFNF